VSLGYELYNAVLKIGRVNKGPNDTVWFPKKINRVGGYLYSDGSKLYRSRILQIPVVVG